jgi:outer membrane protein assembly factor BamB
MATLEVHDGQGRVQFVELAQDHPSLFGTSAACDIVLSGEGVSPVHGRIRWKKGRYRVEASPDAQYVTINGHKMTSSSLHQGDEMTVGPCRLFMMRVDESLEAAPSRRQVTRPDEERTKVLEGPAHYTPASGGMSEPARQSGKRSKGRESLLERNEWLRVLEIPADGQEVAEMASTAGVLRRDQKARPRTSRLRKWFQALRAREEVAPGQERVISSPLVLGLAVSICLLVLLGIGLRAIIISTLATQSYNRAVEVMQDGDFRTAIRDFDAFLAANPKDPRAAKARVLRALANVRQYVSISGGTWSTALEAAREMLETVGGAPEFRDERVDLAELVIRIGEGLADRARRSADAKALEEAESAVPLHAKIAGEPAPAFLKRSRLPGLIDQGRAAVRKARMRADALAAMDRAIGERSAAGVYKSRDALIDQYADLAQDQELIKRMTQANDLIRRAVKVESTRRLAQTGLRPSPLGAATSLVLRSSSEAPTPPAEQGSLVFGLADGLAYGLDAATGAPLWQVFVGLASPFAPQAISGDPSVLVVDARHNELMRLDGRTGKVMWRLELGEPVESPPLVLGNQLFQVLPSGKLVVIGLETGESSTTVNLGLPLSQAPINDESGRFLYVVGRRDCLFVVARDPLACVAVEYLGHEEGSIPCAPARLGRFLVIVENDRPTDARWRVLVLDEDGKAKSVQKIDVPGWIWGAPPASGSVIWATGDKGGIEAYALGDYASSTPLRSLARLAPDAASSGPSFGLATSERELWLAAGRSGRYELDAERGEITSRSSPGQSGPALGPLQLATRHVILTFQDPESGGTSLLGLDRASGNVAWQTILGATWPTPLAHARGVSALETYGRTGQAALITADQIERGGFINLLLPRPGDFRIPSGQVLMLEGDGPGVAVIASGAGSNVVWTKQNEAANPGKWRKVELPTILAAMPLVWDRALLIPGVDGRAYLVDPLTAKAKAEPFVPVFERDHRGKWLAPARLDQSAVVLADQAGRVRRLALKQEPVPRLAIEAQTLLDKPIVADPASTGGAVVVATADQKVRALSARDLSPLGAWPLEAPLVGNPIAIGDHVFVFDGGGGVLCIGRDVRRLWSIKLAALAAGAPVIEGGLVWFLDRSGRLEGRSLADGAPRQHLELAALPAGGLILAGTQTLVPIARGTVQPVALQPSQTRKP